MTNTRYHHHTHESFNVPTLKITYVQQPNPNFWSYFISLFAGMPPEVGQFLASLLGGAVGLIFFPPVGWRGAFSQIFVSWVFSHYFSTPIQKRWFADLPIESVRVGTAFGAWVVVSLAAWVLKKILADPAKAARFIRKLADLFDDKP